MPRINLLPWREEERKTRQRDFGVALAGGVVAAVLVVMATMFAYSQMIKNQESRNARLLPRSSSSRRALARSTTSSVRSPAFRSKSRR